MLTYYITELPQEMYVLEWWSVLQWMQTLKEFKAGSSFLKDEAPSPVLKGNLESTFSHWTQQIIEGKIKLREDW